MFDTRIRLMSDTAVKGRVLPTVSMDTTLVDSASATVSFVVSEKVSGRLDAPQIVAVEYSNGGAWVQPRNGLYMVTLDDSDDADPAGTVRFTGQSYVLWLMQRTYLHWHASSKNGERSWTDATVGGLIGFLMNESQSRGWAPTLGRDFSTTKDSAGASWTAAETLSVSWRLLTPLSTSVQSLADQGLFDWWTEGTTLRMFRPGAGVVRENLVLGGPKFSARPVKSSFEDVFTHLTVVPEKADYWLYLTNTGANNRFGRLEATMTQSGIRSHATATKLAQPTLSGGRAVKREYSFDWAPAGGGPIPFVDFNIGDVVTAKTRHGKSLQRVIGIQVTKNGATPTVRVIVGDKLLTQAAKVARRTGAGSIGGTIGGAGAAIPISPGPTYTDPTAPTGLHVESNVGTWREDGTAQATIELGWNAVSQSLDGSEVDIRQYEVAERVVTGVASVFATTDGLSVTVSSWEPGVSRLVKVRAVSFNGKVSGWSDEIAVVPEVPASIIPKPVTGLAVVSNVGAFEQDGSAVATVTLKWDAVVQSIDDVLVDIAEYEVAQGLTTWRVTGLTTTLRIPTGAHEHITVRARTTLGVWGDPSTGLNITGATPAYPSWSLNPPTLTTALGIVSVRWDGTVNGAYPSVSTAPGFQGVRAMWQIDGGPFVIGPMNTPVAAPADVAQIATEVGGVVKVYLYAFDTLGRAITLSAESLITATGIPISSIPGLEGELDDIRHTSDGKNRVFVSVAEPTAEAIGDLWLQLDPTETSVVTINVWNGTVWAPQVLYAQDIIAAGSIIGTLIKAGTLEVNHVSPTFGNDLSITANESVTIIVGRQDEQSGQIADLDAGVDVAQAAAVDAADAAGAAQAAADGAAVTASGAADAADEVGQRLDQHQTYYRFGVEGLAIGDPNVNSELRLKPDRIEMTQNNVVVSYWEGGVFVADEARLDSAQIGNHQFMAYGVGRTIVKPL